MINNFILCSNPPKIGKSNRDIQNFRANTVEFTDERGHVYLIYTHKQYVYTYLLQKNNGNLKLIYQNCKKLNINKIRKKIKKEKKNFMNENFNDAFFNIND